MADWECAEFQDQGSSPASMEAGTAIDAWGCFPDHDVQQADAEAAYIQSDFVGTETWVALPEEAWPDSWYLPSTDVTGKRTPTTTQIVAQCGNNTATHS